MLLLLYLSCHDNLHCLSYESIRYTWISCTSWVAFQVFFLLSSYNKTQHGNKTFSLCWYISEPVWCSLFKLSLNIQNLQPKFKESCRSTTCTSCLPACVCAWVGFTTDCWFEVVFLEEVSISLAVGCCLVKWYHLALSFTMVCVSFLQSVIATRGLNNSVHMMKCTHAHSRTPHTL